MFSQRVLVALDTGQGVVYAPASGWDRVYLLWTFRNFRSLPQNVLSPRQQQLIGSLYRESSNHHQHELHDAVVVGTVEEFRPSSLSTGSSSLQAGKLFAELTPFYARFANGMTLKVGTAALVVAMAALAWHQSGAQPLSGSVSAQAAVNAQPTHEPIAIAQDVIAKSETTKSLSPELSGPPPTTAAYVGTDAPVVQRSEAPPEPSVAPSIMEPPAHALATAGKPNDSVASTRHPTSVSSKIYEALADEPRMQISGRPRKLVYPVCPETQARGKVSLQAVVGYDGAVSRVRVLTGDRALAAAAVEAVRQWRYEPFSGAAPLLERETNITVSFISNEVVAVSFPNSAPLSR